MATTTSVSASSGIDFTTLTNSIIADRSKPITQLQTQSSTLSKRSTALKQLNTKLAALTSAAKSLKDQSLATGHLATSSNNSVLSVSATDSAANSSFGVSVTRLASSLTQQSRSYSSSSTAVLTDGNTSATFELRKGGASSGTAITIDSSNNSLAGLRDAINKAGAGVKAIIIDTDGTGTQNRLVLTSTDTGSAGRVELVETSSTGTASDLGLTSTNIDGNGFASLDASFSIGGIALTRSSNAISDAISGVTLNLKATGTSTVNIDTDTSDVSSDIRTFVAAYNDVQDFINSQYTKDSSGKFTGALVSDSTLRSVQQQIREALGTSSTTNGGTFTNLTQLGIGRDQDGKLTIDNTTFSNALTNNLSDVRSLLAGSDSSTTGIASTIYDSFNKLSDSITGSVQSAIAGYDASVKSLNSSITDQVDRLSALKDSLTRQFAIVDAAIAQLNNQNSSLTSLIASFSTSSSSK